MNEIQTAYLEAILPSEKEFNEIRAYAAEYHVPIMDKASIHFLCQLALIQEPKSILELGTAIGYSSIKIASVLPEVHITTLERDNKMIEVAKENIKTHGFEEMIDIVPGDALESLMEIRKKEKVFDLIFIDAAKAQYERFFTLVEPLLNKGGIIVCDNVLFKGYVANPNHASSARLKKLAKKVEDFNRWLSEKETYHTSVVPIGDGISISKKRSSIG